MNTMNKLCFAAALALSLSACGGGDTASAPAKPAATPAPAPAPAAPAPAPAAAAPAAVATASPPECDAYIARVSKCMDKLGASNPMAATYKQQMDAAKAQWAAVQDKAALAGVCKQANDAFNQSATMLKCE